MLFIYDVVADVPDACLTKGQVAVTFDEGPASSTLNILNGLQQANIKATFHIVTKYLSNIAVSTNLRTAYERGHLIGLRFPTEKDPKSMTDVDIKQTLLLESFKIFKQIGVYPKYLRLPANGYDDRVVSIATALGFVVTQWNIDTFDFEADVTGWKISNAYVTQLNTVAQGQGRFISLHRDLYKVYTDESIMVTVNANVSSRGYTFVTLDKCLSDSAYRGDNKDPTGQVGDNYAENTFTGKSGAFSVNAGAMQVLFAGIVAFIFNWLV